MEQKIKTQTNELMSWQAFRRDLLENIEDLKEEIKRKTETERAKMKSYRKDLKAANWKIDQLFDSIEEDVEANENVTATLTLDDFDVSGSGIDIELAKGEMKQALKEEKEGQ